MTPPWATQVQVQAQAQVGYEFKNSFVVVSRGDREIDWVRDARVSGNSIDMRDRT